MQTHRNTYKYILAFGSNVGNRRNNLLKSLELLKEFIDIQKQTTWVETKPLTHDVYKTDDHENYLNFICEAESSLAPDELYENIAKIEDIIGHPRARRWMPRKLDVDILFCSHNDSTSFSESTPFPFKKQPNFFVPHLDYFNRSFWREMVEKELNIKESILLKHFSN